MNIAVQLEPATESPAEVEYRWDPDTDILSAQLAPRADGEGLSGSVGLEGRDGSWLILDVAAGRINGVEVAVWPDVRKLPALEPPSGDVAAKFGPVPESPQIRRRCGTVVIDGASRESTKLCAPGLSKR